VVVATIIISPRTVEQHLASARGKLGAYSTAQAIAIATRRHIITSRVV
jgi:DNA-binding CsgD family transcriptional regulator